MLKRIFLSLMAVVLVVGLCPTVALANESSNADNGIENVAAVETSVVDNAVASAEITEGTALSTTLLETDDIASGTLGSCTWVIDASGCLTIAPADGISGEFSMGSNAYSNSWPWYNYLTDIVKAKTTGSVSASGSLAYMFYGATYLTAADLSSLDVSGVTSLSNMFSGCTFLESLDLLGWNTLNVSDMSSMFSRCIFLSSVDVSDFDTSKVTDMRDMFLQCSSLAALNLTQWDTANATNMSSMFDGCSDLAYINLSTWDTENVVDMSQMFDSCTSLSSLDARDWNVSSVTNMYRMFNECKALESFNASSWNTSHVTNMSSMFELCTSLESLDLSGWNTSRVTNTRYMFDECRSLVSLNLSGWDTPYLLDTTRMFGGCYSLAYLDLSSFDTSHVTSTSSMFDCCYGLRTVAVGEKFAFVDGNYLPKPMEDGYYGKWMSADGTVYDSPSLIPNNVATTYTAVFPRHMTTYSGTDRYETSRSISNVVASSGIYGGVIVCSGENGKFADALCAAGLSGVLDYPIVLVNGSSSFDPNKTTPSYPGIYIPDNSDYAYDSNYAITVYSTAGNDLINEIEKLVGTTGDIIVLGGESTVGDIITDLIVSVDSDGIITRISGADRYATAEAVYEYGETHGGWSSDYAVLAKGNDFPDALGAASFCTTNAAPMLLTDQNDASLPRYAIDAAAQASEVVIVGGTSSVSTTKENTLRNYATVERFGEATRYETNLSFARWQLNHGMSIDSAGIATGTNFPDALGSSYLLSLTSSVLLLTSKTESENTALYDFLADNAQSISNISVFGGDASVTPDTRTAIQSAIGGEWQTVNK